MMSEEKRHSDDIERELEGAKLNLEEERELLDQLAEECMRAGKNLADDRIVMEQSRKVDQAILRLYDLNKLLEHPKVNKG